MSRIGGKAIPVRGNDIDTDRIIPARFLKEITFGRMGEYPFYDERFDSAGNMKDHPFNREDYQGASILLANANFGCGSSREHAPQSLIRWGIKAVVAESFAEIFAGNCTMLGTPTVCASAADAEVLQKIAEEKPETVFTLDLESGVLHAGELRVSISMPESRKRAFLEGTWDSTSLLMAHAEEVRELAAWLPDPIRGERS
ncbi:MAG: 3-isopropylmalate dehydratase small subunit [Salinispira sp.]